ncbi:hypothetical protein MARCHEWKA_01880 [Brevundimonas phage vB_BpoS-Marchewka]|uniref:Uncharacterized protein n=1 Tax=Brevundimonas phage vB_BpoS-Marchewka TaxID=2948604 RepID=A0A9E7SSF2_9CAUD|nr:hypothetical protein MARCHEWKA_01880 [Brevundimonas phage vB_BpoS-Marchewka]UTC29147.1 hypothetical protein BAMBUS_00640 [Brevundimonas phage vB_BpoS-Bambus]
MPATETYICLTCRKDFTARTADRLRGWARFCCKSCKAKQMKPGIRGRRVTHVIVDEYALGGSVANGAYHDFDDTHPFSGDALEP